MSEGFTLRDRRTYHGEFSPEAFAFNRNLQEFKQAVALLVDLQTAGNLSASRAYASIEVLWQNLSLSKVGLRVEGEGE
ncbi:MAG: hypothetical protein AAFX40_05635 [Cyanobacteria bacterium J06639_1]